jgi:signal peptidase II
MSPAAKRPAGPALHWLLFVALSVGSTGCDLWTKEWAASRLSAAPAHARATCVVPPGATRAPYQRLPTAVRAVVPGYLELEYAENCGAAWSMFEGAPRGVRLAFFGAAAVGAMAFLVVMYRGMRGQSLAARLGPPLIVAGALGNVADRVRRGYVVDFIHAHLRDRYDYPVFNVADVLLAVGIGLLVLTSLRRTPPRSPQAAASG